MEDEISGEVQWIRVSKLPMSTDIGEILGAIAAQEPQIAKPMFDGWGDVIGVVYPEEVQQGIYRDGWIFINRNKIFGRTDKLSATLIRTLRAGRADLTERVPELSPASSKTIVIVGLGCLGAPSALQFARNGVRELRLLDFDFIDPGSTVRWPYGLPAFGRQKTSFLKEQIELNYPYTGVLSEDLLIGDAIATAKESEVLDRFFRDADLIYDATAEWGLNILLSHLARENGLPYVWLSTTNGAWGGVVGRTMPGRTEGCFSCFGYHLSDNAIPTPNVKPGGLYQPTGCADPTFTGASFDAETIALAGVRLAISTICESRHNLYPDVAWDVGVVNLRDENGAAIAPTWTCKPLTRHPSCPQHG